MWERLHCLRDVLASLIFSLRSLIDVGVASLPTWPSQLASDGHCSAIACFDAGLCFHNHQYICSSSFTSLEVRFGDAMYIPL
jgi:hypothetical protein